jgi:hypothetical protein
LRTANRHEAGTDSRSGLGRPLRGEAVFCCLILMIVVGNRRVKAAIKAALPVIDVLVCDTDEAVDAMRWSPRT